MEAPIATDTLPSRSHISCPECRSVATAANGMGSSENSHSTNCSRKTSFTRSPLMSPPQAEVRELEHALPVERERPRLQLVEPARGKRGSDERADRASRDEIGLDAGFG